MSVIPVLGWQRQTGPSTKSKATLSYSVFHTSQRHLVKFCLITVKLNWAQWLRSLQPQWHVGGRDKRMATPRTAWPTHWVISHLGSRKDPVPETRNRRKSTYPAPGAPSQAKERISKSKATSQQDLLIHPKEREKNHFVTLYTDNTYSVLYTYYISFYTRKIYIKM